MSTYATTTAAPIALARVIALRASVAARVMLRVLAVVVITHRITLALLYVSVLMLVTGARIHMSAAARFDKCCYVRGRNRPLPVQKCEQKKAVK